LPARIEWAVANPRRSGHISIAVFQKYWKQGIRVFGHLLCQKRANHFARRCPYHRAKTDRNSIHRKKGFSGNFHLCLKEHFPRAKRKMIAHAAHLPTRKWHKQKAGFFFPSGLQGTKNEMPLFVKSSAENEHSGHPETLDFI
jgi:hypothetical protein